MTEPGAPEPPTSLRPAGSHLRPLTTDGLTPLRFLVLGQAALVGLLLLVALPAELPFSLHHPGIFGYDLWLEFAQQVAWGRFGYVGDHWPENTSLASTLQYLSRPFGPAPTAFAKGPLYLAYAIYAASFVTCVVFDLRDRVRLDDRSWLLRIYLYAPFLVAMPKLSFHYGLVLLLPLTVALLWARLEARDRRQRRVIDVMLVGVLLSQFPSPAAELTSGLPVLATIPE